MVGSLLVPLPTKWGVHNLEQLPNNVDKTDSPGFYWVKRSRGLWAVFPCLKEDPGTKVKEKDAIPGTWSQQHESQDGKKLVDTVRTRKKRRRTETAL